MPFILGAKGNIWAWRKANTSDTTPFLRRQKFWARAGIIVWLLQLPLLYIIPSLNSSGLTRALTIANTNTRLIEYFGTPIEKASRFNIQSTYHNTAQCTHQTITFPAKDPKATATLTFNFEKASPYWILKNLTPIQLIAPPTLQTSLAYDNNTKGFVVSYSHGYTPQNKQLYESKKRFHDTNQLLDLFYTYATGSDLHTHTLPWAQLAQIHSTPFPTASHFTFK